jgi:hypothetical protein
MVAKSAQHPTKDNHKQHFSITEIHVEFEFG